MALVGTPPLDSCRLRSCISQPHSSLHALSSICIKVMILASCIHVIFRSFSEQTSLPGIVPFGFIVFLFCSMKKFILTDSSLTRMKTEYSQNSQSHGVCSLAASTPLLSVFLPLALVPVSRTFLGASRTSGTSRTRCLSFGLS